MARIARRIVVSGRVQGVGFRWSTLRAADELGVAGWVRNLPDGTVEAWVEAEAEAVERMQAWLAAGPRSARVDALDVREREPEGLSEFSVRH